MVFSNVIRETLIMDRVAIFVDVQNVFYTVKETYQSHFDYAAFLKEVTTGRRLVKAIAYAIDKGDQRQRRFQQILKRLGFEVKLQPFIQRGDGGITVDMLEHANQADTLILVSGDGDYAPVVAKIAAGHETTVEVYGVQDLTAHRLISAATRFIPIQGNLLLPIPTTW
jgi:uncharacterized LabA/DUF88 family protein